MVLDGILGEILSYIQFLFICVTMFLVIYEFKEVYLYEQENEEVERQESVQEDGSEHEIN